jgi:hypothetical protein
VLGDTTRKLKIARAKRAVRAAGKDLTTPTTEGLVDPGSGACPGCSLFAYRNDRHRLASKFS